MEIKTNEIGGRATVKKIAILVPSLRGGGAEKVASLLSQEFVKKHDVYLLLFNSEDIAYEFDGNLIDVGVKPHRSFFMKIINSLKRIKRVKKIKKENNIDITISLMGGANFVNVLSRVNDKVIISIASYISRSRKGFYNKMSNLKIKRTYNKADVITVLSQSAKNELINEFGISEKKIKIIYNPCDIAVVESLANEDVEEEYIDIFNHPVVITAGRLSNPKGHWHLIRAFKKVKTEITDAKLLILGQGELEGYLNGLVNELGLEDDILFLGFKKNPFKYIKNSTVFVLSSLYESFGNVLIEAMALGKPIVSTNCKSGPREILNPSNGKDNEILEIEYSDYGILVPTLDGNKYMAEPLTSSEESLAEAVIETLNDEKLRREYSVKGLKRVKEFEIKTIMDKWYEIID